MDLNDLLLKVPTVLRELSGEFIRRVDEELEKNQRSQIVACFYLALRCVSLIAGLGRIVTPQSRDSSEVIVRAFLEARDLLLTFRFDHKGTRDKVAFWFAGQSDSSWKAEHTKCEAYFSKLGYPDSQFAIRWSMTTTLSHPTLFACTNSARSVALWGNASRISNEDHALLESKVADYLLCIATLIIFATHDLSDLIPLHCDISRMPSIDSFHSEAFSIAGPIVNRPENNGLPPGSYRS